MCTGLKMERRVSVFPLSLGDATKRCVNAAACISPAISQKEHLNEAGAFGIQKGTLRS